MTITEKKKLYFGAAIVFAFIVLLIILKTSVDPKPEPATINTEPVATHPTVPDDWLTSSSGGVTFSYPANFKTTYYKPFDWPPQVQILNQAYSCNEAGAPGERTGETDMKVINGREYCVTRVTEAAAGTVYNQFAYAYALDANRTAVLTFTTRHPNCGVYSDPQRTACEEELQKFSIDDVIGEIVETLSNS